MKSGIPQFLLPAKNACRILLITAPNSGTLQLVASVATRAPSMSVVSSFGPLLRYFSVQPRVVLDRLFADGWTCQGLLRALPPIARLYALRLACAQGGLPAKVVDAWSRTDESSRTKHEHALEVLRRLSLLEDAPAAGSGEALLHLHEQFAAQLLNGLCIGGVLESRRERADDALDADAPTLHQLDQMASHTWELVLQAVIVPPDDDVELAMQCEGATLQELLIEAGLLERAPDGHPTRFVMSHAAHRFMLMPTHAQVWRLVHAYMKLADKGTRGIRHAMLCFLMRLGLLQTGLGHRMDDPTLDDEQRATLADMALLGLVLRPPNTPHLYYATSLCQHLLSTSATVGAAAPPTGSSDGAYDGAGGFLILETNFRLYAYTSSTLWARVLASFARIEYVLPDLIVGSLTRQTVHRAVDAGVSAAEIEAFLKRNAHPRMAAQAPVLPETVVNQVRARRPAAATASCARCQPPHP